MAKMAENACDNENHGNFMYSHQTLEKLNKKLIKFSLSAIFKERCFKETFLPKYTLILV